MIEIDLNPRQREIVHIWIDTVREKAGHRGDGMAVFPDEAIVEQKLDRQGPIRLPRLYLEMVLEWAETTHQNLAFTPEEIDIINKISETLKSG